MYMANVEPTSAVKPFCVWSQSSRNFAIQIPGELIGSLGAESLLSFKRVPRRGLETGGILRGRTEFRDNTTTFWIEGFTPIESEHRFGPSYVLSDSDLANFETELVRTGTASLGIFRSQTRSEELTIHETDAALFEKCFGVSENLFLMLAPVSRIGAFYFLEDGNLKCVHQFTFVSSLSGAMQDRFLPNSSLPALASAGTHGSHGAVARISRNEEDSFSAASQRAEHRRPLRALSSPGPEDGSMLSQNRDSRRFSGKYGPWITEIRRRAAKLWSDCSGRISGIRPIWLLAALTVAVLAANLLSYSSRHAEPKDPQSPNYLYLTMEQNGSALRLLWDGNSSAVRGATRAVLHIQDGDEQSDRELAQSELVAGQFTYQPQHPAVTFRLNVYAGEPNAVGLLQVMFPASPVTKAPPTEPSPAVPTTRPGAPFAVKPIMRATEAAAPSGPLRQSEDKKDQDIQTSSPAVKNFQTPSPPVKTVEVSKIGPTPAREPYHPSDLDVPRQRPAKAEGNEFSTSGRELTVRTSAKPLPGSRLGRLFRNIPLVGRLKKPVPAIEAIPAHQVQPIVRMPKGQELLRPVAIGVKVYVGESGAVSDAEVVDYGDDPMSPTLANAALAAARNWAFEPSRVDNIPVASQVLIRFYFSP